MQFIDRTDDYDNLVHTKHGLLARRESGYMHGNLFQVEERLTGEGVTFIKEGPTPVSYTHLSFFPSILPAVHRKMP